jgi:hypothetical protein
MAFNIISTSKTKAPAIAEALRCYPLHRERSISLFYPPLKLTIRILSCEALKLKVCTQSSNALKSNNFFVQ